MHRLLLTLVGTLLLAAAGCDSSLQQDSRQQLRDLARQAEATWTAQDIDDYRLTYQRGCTCPPSEAGPFEVTVQGGVRVAATFQGMPIGADSLARYFTVEDLFDVIDQGFARNPDRISLRFAPEQGYPLFILFDYDAQRTGEEDAVAVVAVVALPEAARR